MFFDTALSRSESLSTIVYKSDLAHLASCAATLNAHQNDATALLGHALNSPQEHSCLDVNDDDEMPGKALSD